jgi:hypothetical protein
MFGEELEEFGFHGLLALHGRRIFRDEDFAALYHADTGRPSVPPSTLALATLLQHYDNISDEEVIARCRFDLRWKAALHLDVLSLDAPFAKSTFQAFRGRLVMHDRDGQLFERSVQVAREAGLVPKSMTLSLDSSPVRGRGAVRDTYNLLSDAIGKVLRGVAKGQGVEVEGVARDAGLERHVLAPSFKGSVDLDWSSDEERRVLLAALLDDCRKVIALARDADCAGEAAALIERIIGQDVDEDPDGGPPKIRRGVAKDRVPSVTDPESRHGHKSSGKGYTGHKAHVGVVETGVITHVDVTAPSEPEGAHVSEAVSATREVTGGDVTQALGDSAYSSAEPQRQAASSGVALRTKMPRTNSKYFGPIDFTVSPDGTEATCPAGHPSRYRNRSNADVLHLWSAETCGACPLKQGCTKASKRTLRVRPDFHDRRARERWARSPQGQQELRKRIVVEHALGRMKHRGAGRARYLGRRKTRLQWLLTAAAVNLSLVWSATSRREAA